MISLFKHNLKVAIRNFSKEKGQTLICILGLAMGILSFTVCTYVIRLMVSVNSKFPNYEQIGKLESFSEQKDYRINFPLSYINQLQSLQIDEIEAIAASHYGYGDGTMIDFESNNGKSNPYFIEIIYVNQDFMKVFSVKLLEGDLATLFSQPRSVILSQEAAQKIYGDESPLGKTVKSGENLYTIRGVMKDLPIPNSITNTTPIDMLYCVTEDDNFTFNFWAFALLKRNISLDKLNEQLAHSGTNFRDESSETSKGTRLFIPRISKLNNEKDIRFWLEAMIPIGVGFMVLLAGLINFLNFTIGSFYNRIRELSLRKSLGAYKKEIFFQLFTELALEILLATILSLCITELVLPSLLNNLWSSSVDGPSFPFDITIIAWHQLQYLFFILVGCGVISWFATDRLLQQTTMWGIRGGTNKGSKHGIRNFMLGIQFFIFLSFFGATAILFMQSATMKKGLLPKYTQEEKDRTIIVTLDFPQTDGIEQEVVRQLASSQWVEDHVIMGRHDLPLHQPKNFNLNSGETVGVGLLEAGSNLCSFLHISLLQGKIPDAPQQVLVNQSFYQLLEKEGIHNMFTLFDVTYHISGVIEDTEMGEVGNMKYLIIKSSDKPFSCMLRSIPGQTKKMQEHIDHVMRQWVPNSIPLKVYTFEQQVGIVRIIIIGFRNLFLAFALICLFINLLGIYSAISLDTQKRQKEVAIRKINGASFKDIIILFGKLYVLLLAVTAAFALPLLWLLATYVLMDFRVQYNFNNPLFWIIFLLIVAGIITITIGYRLYLTIRLNPADVIKAE